MLIACGKKHYQKELPIPPNTHEPVTINGEAKGFNHISGGIMYDSFFTLSLALTDGNNIKCVLGFHLVKKALGRQTVYNILDNPCDSEHDIGSCKPYARFSRYIAWDEPGERFYIAEGALREDNWIEIEEIKEGEYIKGSYNIKLFREMLYGNPQFPDTIHFTNGTFRLPLDK